EDKIRSDDKVTLTSILSKQHIPNVLERIQDFHDTKQEDVVAWIDQLEVALDLTDHAQGKWSKLAAWYLKGEALSWYIKNKNQVYDWDSFRQMIIEKYPTCDNHHNDLIKLEQAIPSSTTILNTKSVSTIDLSNNLLKTLMEHKVKQLPIFSGKDNENVTKWLNNITQIGKMVNCSDDELYVVAKLKLKGEAQTWYQKNQDKICDWKTFNQLLSHRFPAVPPSNDREILRQLAGRKQAWNEPISRFYRDIMNLCDKYDSNMADSSRIGYLQDGLKPKLQHYALSQQITTPQQFFNIMQQHEHIQVRLSNVQLNDLGTTATIQETSTRKGVQQSNTTSVDRPQQQQQSIVHNNNSSQLIHHHQQTIVHKTQIVIISNILISTHVNDIMINNKYVIHVVSLDIMPDIARNI
ncbi:unnamed protein product, partial [Didymodactylos carnosus]